MKFSNNAILSLVIIIIIGLLYILVNSNKSREAFMKRPKMPTMPKMPKNKIDAKIMVTKILNKAKSLVHKLLDKFM